MFGKWLRVALLVVLPIAGYGELRSWMDGVPPDISIRLDLLAFMFCVWVDALVED